MSPKPYEIYLIPVRLNESSDPRPCVVIYGPVSGMVEVLPISGQMDLFNRAEHFLLTMSHPDFAATGLSKSGYVLPRIVNVPTAQLLKLKGSLKGDLLKDFIFWLG